MWGGAGNFRDCIVGPYFLPENLAAEMDLDLLESTTDPDLMNAFEEDNCYRPTNVISQRDALPYVLCFL